MANELKEKQQKLKKVRVRNIVLNLVCICLAGSGLWWTATYFWRYVNYEVTNDAFVDQYVAPLNVRASGYIKEVRFKEHQYVRQGDTLLMCYFSSLKNAFCIAVTIRIIARSTTAIAEASPTF